jgi:hypothetical protein
MPPNTVKVDRTSQWGNLFVIGKVSPGKSVLGAGTPSGLCGVPVRDRAQAIELFRKWIYSESNLAGEWRRSVRALRGKNLAC